MTISDGVRDSFMEINFSVTQCGIHTKSLERVLDLFSTTKEEVKNTGLGLTVVCRIIDAYSGNISVSSRVVEDTTFNIKLQIEEG